jgi:amidase
LPLGLLDDGNPFSLTLAGTAFSEGSLLSLAHAYERAYPKRVWPKLDES